MLRWQTAGESHGEALVAMIEGIARGRSYHHGGYCWRVGASSSWVWSWRV